MPATTRTGQARVDLNWLEGGEVFWTVYKVNKTGCTRCSG